MTSGLTSVDYPNLGQQVDFSQLQFDYVFGAVYALLLQAVRGLDNREIDQAYWRSISSCLTKFDFADLGFAATDIKS